MGWTYVDEALSSRELQQVHLEALEPNCDEHDVMLYQHGGTVRSGSEGYANEDSAPAFRKHITQSVKQLTVWI
jgi:hypothetical protein